MTENKKYNRKCIATGLSVPEDELIRFDYNKNDNKITLDLNRSLKGRGAYFIPTKANWEYIKKNKCLNKTFRTAVSNETYNQIEKELEGAKCLKKVD